MKKILLLIAGLCLSEFSICDALVDVNTWAEVVGMDEAKKPTLENVNAKLRTVFRADAMLRQVLEKQAYMGVFYK